MTKIYPYDAWVLTPSYKPKKVVIARSYGSTTFSGDLTDEGKYYQRGDICETLGNAIALGRLRLDEQEAKVKKMKDAIAKRRAALDKAEAA